MAGLNITFYKERSGYLQASFSQVEKILHQSEAFKVSAELPYTHYPVSIWETDDFLFIVEGFFFDLIDYKKKCEAISEYCFIKNQRCTFLHQNLNDIDAEFVLLIIRKSDDNFVLINDALGRLPIYIIQSEETWNFTRNILSVKDKIPLELNKEAAIDALVFGFPLDCETLYNGLTRISGGSVIFREGAKLCCETYYQINYEEIKNVNWNWEALPNLVQLFTDGIINRIKFSDFNIVPLSGGLDSRTVAAGFNKENIDCRYISFQDADGNTENDIKVAEKISGVYQT
jgi:asparagine synthase (glutamine-hydrolysing)